MSVCRLSVRYMVNTDSFAHERVLNMLPACVHIQQQSGLGVSCSNAQ